MLSRRHNFSVVGPSLPSGEPMRLQVSPPEVNESAPVGLRSASKARAAEGAIYGRQQVETPAFKNWFGASKVVDAKGLPLVVFHGTEREFSVFKNGCDAHKGSSTYNATDQLGIFFTTSADDAAGYAKRPGQNIMPVYLAITKPMPISLSKWRTMSNSGADGSHRQVWNLQEKAREGGFDGFVVKGEGHSWWVALRPDQIKSALGNCGSFDPLNTDLRA